MPCPACGTLTARVHGFHGRVLADVPVDGRRIVVSVRVRRLACPVLDCSRQTFREQVPGVVERYQRRTNRLTDQLNSVVKELASRAGARLCRVLACTISSSTALRMLMRQVVTPLRVPRVLGVDDFALKRRHRYATVIIDAETGERIDVLPDRTAQTLATWLSEHPGAQDVCRDGSATYAEANRQALPEAVQVSDRWHLWSNLCDKVLAEVRSHAACWATAVNPTRPGGVREQTTRERWQRVHHLLDQGVGLLECARRLDVALNTVQAVRPHEGAHRRPPRTPLQAHTRRPLPRAPAPTPKACPEMTELARLTSDFAQLLTPAEGNDAKLTDWITTVRAVDLPHLHSFANGLELDRAAVDTGLTRPYHNGRTEGVNTRTKRIMRQMHGRAGFPLLRHRILLQ